MARRGTLRCLPIPLGLTILLAAGTAWGQIVNVTNATSTPVPGSGHDYIEMLAETVSPANGSVSARINVPAPKGRRLTLPMGFAYDSNGLFHVLALANGSFAWVGNGNDLHKGGWGYSIPIVTNTQNTKTYTDHTPPPHGPNTYRCNYRTGYVFTDPAGTRHSLNVALRLDTWSECHLVPGAPTTISSGGNEFVKANIVGGTKVWDASGTLYSFTNTYLPDGSLLKLSSVEDTNGNMITVTNSALGGTFTVQDTLGRNVFESSSFGTTGDTLHVSGLSNPYSLTWGTYPTNYNSGGHRILADAVPCTTLQQVSGSQSEITRIDLPNGKSYTFEYDSVYGLLKKMTYPTGGYVRYEWATNLDSDYASSPTTRPDLYPAGVCHYLYGAPVVHYRYVSYDGTQDHLKQEFTYATVWSGRTWTSKTTTVKTYDLKRSSSVYFTTTYTYVPRSVPPPPYVSHSAAAAIPVEQTVSYSAWGSPGTILKTVTKDWQGPYLQTKEDVTLDGTLLSKSSLTYEPCGASGPIKRPGEKKECDGSQDCSSSWQRKTTYVYDTSSSTICDRPSSVTIAGSGGQAAQTTYTYGTAVVSAGVTVGRDTSYNNNSGVPRGNATEKKLWLNTTGSYLTTQYSFDDTGQVRSVTDPRANSTNYTYDCENAYVSRIDYPLNQFETFSHDCASGRLSWAEDRNQQRTTYTYDDSLGRLTEINYPDTGLTTYTYNESSYPFNLVTTKKINPSTNYVTNQVVDGLGQVTQNQITSAPSIIKTDTTYDGLSRVWKVSNPYVSTGEATYGLTTYSYDALGRVTSLLRPDGGTVTTAYGVTNPLSDNTYCTSVTDEQNKARKSCSDGLGRLRHVFEDSASLGYETTYQYDALDNLLQVDQKGNDANPANWRTRTFAYDSLSRLTSASNPEISLPNGTLCPISYSYDANGNLTSKVAPLENQNSSCNNTVTTTYAYDALNRLTGKTYSDTTPAASYSYDQTSYNGLAITNGIGRRTGMSDAAGAEAWSYNPMGRVLADSRTTNSVTKIFTYTPNLDGSLGAVAYPTGSVLSYTPDGVSRPVSAVDTAHGITYANNAAYWAHGALNTLTLGSGITRTDSYSNRLQPTTLVVAASGGQRMNLSYNFNTGGGNNGNVMQIANVLNSDRTQNFTYDALNRIYQAKTQATTGQYCWGQNFTIDNWGNLYSITEPSTHAPCTVPQLNLSATATNRLNALGYDAAGNTTSDGVGGAYAYDGENRQTSVTPGSVTYTYDGDGKRVKKSNGTLYWYGTGSDAMLETDLSGNMLNEYIFFAGKRTARRNASGSVYYYFSDHLGTAHIITDASGVTCYDADYYPYGGERNYVNTCPQNYKFTGKERDTETGLDYFGARYDASNLGRFMSPDEFTGGPVSAYGPPDPAPPGALPYADITNPQSLNKYAYVYNNPLRYVDPTGHSCWKAIFGGKCADDPPPPPPPPPPKTPEWKYSQTTGQMSTVILGTETKVGKPGYAGANLGLNNPDYQNVKGDPAHPDTDAGPLPRGTYFIGKQRDNVTSTGKTLHGSERLKPDPGNQMFDRKGFLIHGGDFVNMDSSQGCIVVRPNVRYAIGTSGFLELEVVE